MSQTSKDLSIDFRPNGKPGRGMVVVNLPDGQTFTDDLNIASARARTKYLDRLCAERPAIREAMESEFERLAASEATRPAKGKSAPEENSREALLLKADAVSRAELEKMDPAARRQAENLLADPLLIDRVLSDIHSIGVAGEDPFAVTTYIIGTSRLLSKPLAAIVQGGSSTGKSYVPDCVSNLFPPEAKWLITAQTANALYYLPPGALAHKLVVAGERPRNEDDDRAETTRALREMISGGKLRKAVPVRRLDGVMETVTIEQDGPIAYIESTTQASIFDEDANRCLLLGTDESEGQTRLIHAAQAQSAMRNAPDLDPIIRRHHALQRMLKRVLVRVPFADRLSEAIPSKRVESRRALPMIYSTIQAVALLHQMQRKAGTINHGDTIDAGEVDYVVARELLLGPMGRAVGGGLADSVVRFGKGLWEVFEGESFTSTQAAHDRDLVKSKANNYLSALAGVGVAECLEPSRGPKPATWKMLGDVPEAGAVWLPTLDDLRRPT